MHEIRYLVYTGRKSINTIQKDCEKIADTEGDYKGQLSKGISTKTRCLKTTMQRRTGSS